MSGTDESVRDSVHEAIRLLKGGLEQAQRVGRREVMFEPSAVQVVLAKLEAAREALA